MINNKLKWYKFENSASVSRGAYNFYNRELFLEFKNSSKVRFTHVPKSFWYSLLESESAERYAVKELFPNFQYFQIQ